MCFALARRDKSVESTVCCQPFPKKDEGNSIFITCENVVKKHNRGSIIIQGQNLRHAAEGMSGRKKATVNHY